MVPKVVPEFVGVKLLVQRVHGLEHGPMHELVDQMWGRRGLAVLRVGPGGKLGSHSAHRCVNATTFAGIILRGALKSATERPLVTVVLKRRSSGHVPSYPATIPQSRGPTGSP